MAEIAALGHEAATVNRVWRLLETAEYKRRQAPPGVKITHRAFGRDRRNPIANAFKGPVQSRRSRSALASNRAERTKGRVPV